MVVCGFEWWQKSTCTLIAFRSAKRDHHSSIIDYGQYHQGQSNCATKSHALFCVPVLRDHHIDKRVSRCSIRLPLSPISEGQEQGRSRIAPQHTARLYRIDLTATAQRQYARNIHIHSHVRGCHTRQAKAEDIIHQAHETARKRRQSGFREGSIERL